ncbi:hypothetical protein N7495_000378 [Penicillium taxi]|uniref:uncharacterized protein n=1 Tax=Penicillium taxi TaxID=168475 RepID=UPI0025459300|nr:uncharacterized protein N7495_000378 [Penicillium taxi]KAJ5907696.1 hypothetical protein N7495_000378 [Penicillium taxi]
MPLIKWHKHWQRGIPSYVKCQEHPEDDVEYATRAWRRFVREQWTNDVDEDEQRRNLIERWATADQEFRDGYESRAEDEPPFEIQNVHDPCLRGHLDFYLDDVFILISEWSTRTQALLAKCILALFDWDNNDEHLTQNMSLFMPLEDNKGDIIDNFKLRQSVVRPNFLDMCMALDGTVLFVDVSPKLIIDDRTLETGLAIWLQFTTNGVRKRVYRTQLLTDDFPDHFRAVYSNNDPLEDVLQQNVEYSNEDPLVEDQPVNMRRPFMDVYQVGAYSGEDGHSRRKKDIRDQLDEFAPGYWEAENLGNGIAEDALSRLLTDEGAPLKIVESSELD